MWQALHTDYRKTIRYEWSNHLVHYSAWRTCTQRVLCVCRFICLSATERNLRMHSVILADRKDWKTGRQEALNHATVNHRPMTRCMTLRSLFLQCPSAYFEHAYIKGWRRPGSGENYGSAIFPIETWNHYEAGAYRHYRFHCKNYKRSRRLAFWSASAFSVPPSDIVDFCTGDQKRSLNATCVSLQGTASVKFINQLTRW